MDNKVLNKAVGLNGTLELLEDQIRIRRDGWTSRLYGTRHQVECLSLALIDRVDLTKTVGGLAGYISINGGTDPDHLEDLCISFLLPQENQFQSMLQAIQDQRGRYLTSPGYVKSHEFVIDHPV